MADTYLTWWTSIETDLRKSLVFHATRDHGAMHSLIRTAFEAGLSSATPPSPSTAPEVDERAAFEAWHRSKFATKHSTGQPTRDMHNGIYAEQYGPVHQQQMWEAWQASALASRPAEVDDEGLPAAPTAIPRASNDALIALAKYWKLNGDWMTCKGCRRSLIASRDGEELNHGEGCKFWDQQHPWTQLRELIARRPVQAESVG